jgi:rhamnosyltransferase
MEKTSHRLGPSDCGVAKFLFALIEKTTRHMTQENAEMIESSVLVLTKNEAKNIGRCLEAIYSQKGAGTFEVIVVDSTSTDETLDIARRYPVRIEQIPAESFHHARTRNYAATLASGKFLVYLAADAFPAHSGWLASLLANFSDPTVAAVYGKHLPKPGSTHERQDTLSAVYGIEKIVKEPSRKQELGYMYYFLSTVNAAIRKDVWQATGFPENLRFTEDVGIAKRILDGGWKIVYEPSAAVYHSHHHSLKGLFQRYFDGGVARKQLGIWDSNTKSSMFRDGCRLLRRKVFAKGADEGTDSSRLTSIAQYAVKYAGMVLGRNEHLLPLSVKRRISAFHMFD